MKGNKLHLIILGPPGSGKGTQSELLAEHFNLEIVEMGEKLRALAKKKTPLGRQINDLINKQGRIAPLKIVEQVLRNSLKKISPKKGIIFDGIPRTIGQVKLLSRELKKYNRSLDWLIYLDLPAKEVIKRLSKRRMCSSCGALYIEGETIKKGTKICPLCQGKIIQRPDDQPKIIRQRLRLFRKKTKPVLDYYKKKKEIKFIKINGNQPIKKVFQDILAKSKN